MTGPLQPPEPHTELRRRREQLAEEVAGLHWNLGGLAYEMAIRDHFRLDVLVRRAAMLQERDAELAEVDRLLHMQESSVAGSCPSCGAVRSRGAVFCWQCGTKVMEQAAGVNGESEAVTAEIDIDKIDVAIPKGNDRREGIESASTSMIVQQELGRPVQASP